MTDTEKPWGLSNSSTNAFLVWLEPWAEEFSVPPGSTIIMKPAKGCPLGDVEWTPDCLTVWASASTVEVFIDGVLQKSGSAIIPIPDGLSKGMLGILFADLPEARLGGAYANVTKRPSWWERIKRLLS